MLCNEMAASLSGNFCKELVTYARIEVNYLREELHINSYQKILLGE